MDLSLLKNKELLIKSFFSLSGVSGASVGGWYVYDFGNPTYKSLFEKERYTLNPAILKIQTTNIQSSDSGTEKHEQKFHLCFQEFLRNLDSVEFTYQTPSLGESSFKAPRSSKVSEIKGCTMMRYSATSAKDKWAFESETVIRNDEIGIAVWIEADNTKSFPKHTILFLEKEDVWTIKWGFSSLSGSGNVGNKEIKSPDGSIKENYSRSSDNTQTFENNQYYSGIWEEDESEENELFENVFQFVNKTEFDEGTKNILSPDTIFSSEDRKNIASKRGASDEIYIKGQNLKPWYEPFSKSKGKWNTFKEYCSKKSKDRNIDDGTKRLLIKLCYTENSHS